ncbi:unnamed protein product, partial [Didymodactylos carnosus]
VKQGDVWSSKAPDFVEKRLLYSSRRPTPVAELFGRAVDIASGVHGKAEELFLWLVFMNRFDMALCLCSQVRSPIVACLLGSKIYRTAAKRADTELDKEIEQDYFDKSKIPPNEEKITLARRVKWFYDAPIVRFYYHVIFFILFLGLFSFVLLVDYFPLNIYGETRSGIQNLLIPSTEIILHICFWGLIIDEIYQWVKHQRKEQDYSGDVRNISDIFGIILYLIGFITRFIVLEAAFIVSKISMCMALIFWSIRLLHLFAAYESLGPTLVMIFKMTQQAMLIFICFILIFLFSFSITSMSLLTTTSQVTWMYTDDGQLFNATVSVNGSGTETWNWQLLRDVITWGIWKVFGQIDEPINNSVSTNDSYGAFVFIFAILFVVIANVLLLNVLIAMFKLEKMYDTIIRNNQPTEQLEPDFVRGLMKLYYEHPEDTPPAAINTQRAVPHSNQLVNGFEEEFGLNEQLLPVTRRSRQRSLTPHLSSSTERLSASSTDNVPRPRSRQALLTEENNNRPPN